MANSSALFILASVATRLHPLERAIITRERSTCGEQLGVSSDVKALFFPVRVNGPRSMCDSRAFSPHVLPPRGEHREVMWEGRGIDTTSIPPGFTGAVKVTPAYFKVEAGGRGGGGVFIHAASRTAAQPEWVGLDRTLVQTLLY